VRTGSEALLTGKATGTARWHRRVPDADAGQQDRETFPGRLVRVKPFTGNHPTSFIALGWWNTMITSISEPRGVESVARRARLLGASFLFGRRSVVLQGHGVRCDVHFRFVLDGDVLGVSAHRRPQFGSAVRTRPVVRLVGLAATTRASEGIGRHRSSMPHDEAAPPSHPSAGRGERAARVSAPEGGAVSEQNQRANTVVIGAGPAGLTAAYELGKRDHKAVVLEADDVVGGISRTARVGDWRFDIGGHRFFTKVTPVRELWHEMLPDEDFLLRPRMSRIFYRGRFYDYPLRAFNALRNLGVLEAVRCVLSYLWVRIRPPKDLTTFEGYIASKFGWRLYGIFFKTYTEKVWGVPADQIQADWAAQRVKNLDLLRAIINSLAPRRNQKEITSLIEEFEYPRHGPGMMWERCHELVEGQGGEVHFHHAVSRIEHSDGLATAVIAETPAGEARFPCGDVVSSMPIPRLVQAMDPAPPAEVLAAADGLAFRDFLTVALVVPEAAGFPDNWIYIHAPDVEVGRVQNFRSWSPQMVPESGKTCLGLEYFVTEGDELWTSSDDDLVALGTAEMERLGLLEPGVVEQGFVVRMPKAYPMYDASYHDNVDVLRGWLDANVTNVHPVGRNGMHRYNNQDHSMYTAMLTVENIVDGTSHDVWEVNVEAEYHEEVAEEAAEVSS
jgi:protoporphyrinogen oxidase